MDKFPQEGKRYPIHVSMTYHDLSMTYPHIHQIHCVQVPEDCLRAEATKTTQMTCCTTWYSSTPLRSLICQSRGQWRTQGRSSCMSHPRLCVSTYVAPVQNLTGRVPLIPLFSGGQLNSNDPSLVQQAQGFRLPDRLCRLSGG